MKHSCIVLNERLVPEGVPPVSSLNPAFVSWQPIGRAMKAAGCSNPISASKEIVRSFAIQVMLGDDDKLREVFSSANADPRNRVHPYPIQALTGNYAAYEAALAQTPSGDVCYLAVAVANSDGSNCTWVNGRYASSELLPFIEEASLLGWASGFCYPAETFAHDVFDANRVKHSYLTCISHLFRKEKGQKFDRFIDEASKTDGILVLIKRGDQTSMAAIYAEEALLKNLKVHQMSSARMHDDLVQFRKTTDANTTAPKTA
jgi:hypothetical protein